MSNAAVIEKIDVVLITKKKIWARIEGKFLEYDAPTEVVGRKADGSLSGEVWSGVFLAGSLSPRGNNGKKGLLGDSEVKAADTEETDGRPNSTEIDVTITNPDQPPSNTFRADIPEGAMPATEDSASG